MRCVTFAHLNYTEPAEAAKPPADDPPAEVANSSGEDAKVETEKATAAPDEPAANAEGEGAPDAASTEPPAESEDSKKPDEGTAPAEDDNSAKPKDENGSNGKFFCFVAMFTL